MIFKQFLFGAAIAAGLVLTSCSQESGKSAGTDQAESDAILMNTSPAKPGATAAQPATVLTPAAGQPQTATQGATQTAKTVAAVNPPHGQPGHDCALPVGAPLNGAAGATPAVAAPQVQQSVTLPAPASKPVSNPASSGSDRVNPAHGQPGRDCAVAVGAPLP